MPRSKTRIAYAYGSGSMYGAGRSLLRLVANLPSSYEPLVVLSEKGLLCDALQQARIPYVVLPYLHSSVLGRHVFHGWNLLRFVLTLLPNIVRFARFLRRQNVRLLHTNNTILMIPAIAARLVGIPHIWHVRETLDQYAPMWERFAQTERSFVWRTASRAALRAWQWYVRFICAFSHRVICVSEDVRKPFVAVGSGQKTLVIYNGLELDRYGVVGSEVLPPGVCSENTNDCVWVGTIGDIRAGKGQDLLIRAFALARKSIPETNPKCLIVGGCSPQNQAYLAHLEEMIADLDVQHDVVFTGYMSDPRSAFARLDVFVLPSMQPEPFGTVVLEAMAMRKPIVAVALGGTMEQIEDGESGLLVPPNDPVALAHAIEALVTDQDLRERLATAAHARVVERFSLAAHITQLDRVYQVVLGQA